MVLVKRCPQVDVARMSYIFEPELRMGDPCQRLAREGAARLESQECRSPNLAITVRNAMRQCAVNKVRKWPREAREDAQVSGWEKKAE